MYKCITGENPPDAIERVMDDSLKKISEFGIAIPPQEEAAIIKGMSVSVKDRYQDIKDFCEDLYGGYEEDAYSALQEYILQNPRIQDNAFEQIVTWDCLWFGTYPQTQIREKDGAIYTILKNEKGWDSNNDILVNGIKYHKKEENYFRYEPIKWRILQRDNTTAFLLSDIILDTQPYHKETEEIFWEESYIRNWLNKNFMEAAFISPEQQMIEAMKRVDVADNTYGMPENYTMDKIFLLSEEEISETSNAQRYGFSKSASSYDKARKSESSQYVKDTSWWWVQAADMETGVRVGADGWISKNGYYILKHNAGIRPALCLNLSSNLFSYAGTVSSDGTVNEVDYNSEYGWILK